MLAVCTCLTEDFEPVPWAILADILTEPQRCRKRSFPTRKNEVRFTTLGQDADKPVYPSARRVVGPFCTAPRSSLRADPPRGSVEEERERLTQERPSRTSSRTAFAPSEPDRGHCRRGRVQTGPSTWRRGFVRAVAQRRPSGCLRRCPILFRPAARRRVVHSDDEQVSGRHRLRLLYRRFLRSGTPATLPASLLKQRARDNMRWVAGLGDRHPRAPGQWPLLRVEPRSERPT